jgi:hypothetical protein
MPLPPVGPAGLAAPGPLCGSTQTASGPCTPYSTTGVGDTAGQGLGVAQSDEISGELIPQHGPGKLDETGFTAKFDSPLSSVCNEGNCARVAEAGLCPLRDRYYWDGQMTRPNTPGRLYSGEDGCCAATRPIQGGRDTASPSAEEPMSTISRAGWPSAAPCRALSPTCMGLMNMRALPIC